MKTNKICLCCGKEFYYCYQCDGTRVVNSQKNLFDNENCREVFEVATDYLNGAIQKKDAAVKFGKCDLTNKGQFGSDIKKAINETMGSDSQTTDTTKK